MESTTTAWGRWDCTRCGARNISGRDKRCPSCGDPREAHELAAMRPPDESEFIAGAITDEAELALALDGADWSCTYCGSNNRGSAAACGSCGGRRGSRTSANASKERGDSRRPPVVADAVPSEPSWPPRGAARRRKKIGVGVGVGALVVGVGVWGFADRAIEAQLSALEWAHTTHLERWQDVGRGGWGRIAARPGTPPIGGAGESPGIVVTGCASKHRSDERYSCGTENYSVRESYTCGSTQQCSTSNNGNGSFSRTCRSVSKTCSRSVTKTRTKYCTRPIYDTWCDYTTQAWVEVRAEVARGEGHEGFRFPAIATDADDLRTTQTTEYALTFRAEDVEDYRVVVPRATYDTWSIGERAILTSERFGGVNGFRRPRDDE